MPAKRITTRKTTTHHDEFVGLRGVWGSVAKFGITGCVAASMMYGLLWLSPQQQRQFFEMMKQDRADGFAHGERAVEKIAVAIDKNTAALNSLLANQSAVKGNQGEGLKLSQRMVELLEANVEATKKMNPE